MKKILVCLLLVSSFGWAQGSGQFSGGGGKGNGTVSGQANGVIPLGTTATSITQQSHCNDGVTTSGTVTCSEPFNATSLSAGTAPTACGSATACFAGTEASTAGTPTTGQSYMRFSSTAHNLLFSFNNGAEGPLPANSGGTGIAYFTVAGPTAARTFTFPDASATIPQTIASGTAAMGTSAISSGTCATVVTVSATGVATTDVITATPNADPTGVTGYAVSASGSLYIQAYPTANNVNFKVCNNTSGSLTPSALTLNWRVTR